jgi:hypothetical protein
MTLSKAQIEYEKIRWQKWFWIWERDMHLLANRYYRWRDLAASLGYADSWVDKPWTHADAGKQVKYMLNPYFGN